MSLVTLLGMPSTGKTTYVIALYNAVQDPNVPTSATLVRLPAAAVYLEDGRKRWLAAQEVDRNRRATGELIELDLTVNGKQIELQVPDLAGESFEMALRERAWDAALDALVSRSDAFMVFVHPDQLRTRVSVLEDKKAQRALGLLPEPDPPSEFDVAGLPLQVQVVDLLQIAFERVQSTPLSTRQVPVAVVISAWDLVQAEGRTPPQWLRAYMPLLNQYLVCNVPNAHKVFGVSAQGGQYGPGSALASLTANDRLFVTDGPVTTSDVAKPLSWLLG